MKVIDLIRVTVGNSNLRHSSSFLDQKASKLCVSWEQLLWHPFHWAVQGIERTCC